MSHALLAPSSADVWSMCPGSVTLVSMVPETDKWKSEADEGTAAHWVCEQVLLECVENGYWDQNQVKEYLGWTAPNGIVVTKDMIEGAMMYMGEVDKVAASSMYMNMGVERKVQTHIHPECAGTPDSDLIEETDKGRTLHVFDYKFGHGDVPAFRNKQLTCYLDGILWELGADDLSIADLTIHFHIIQPRCFTENGPVKEWVFPATSSILDELIRELTAAADEAMSPGAETKSGNHCRYCPARHQCGSARLAALDGVRYQNTASPEVLSDQGISFEAMALDNAMRALKYRLEAIEDEIQSRVSSGKNIPHYSVVRGRGRRAWDVDMDTLKMVVDGIDVNLVKDPEPVTPAEAKRRLMTSGMTGKEADSTLEGLASAPSTGFKVTRTDESKATLIFSNLSE